MLLAPDNHPAYKAEKALPFLFYMSGRAKILGGWSGSIAAFDVKRTRFGERIEFPPMNVTATVELQLERFLTQRVLCYRGQWVSREAVIKYVANVASGVHSGAAKDGNEIILARIRSGNSLRVGEGGVHLDMFAHGIDSDESKFTHRPDSIDPVLIELLAAATFLCNSPFVLPLEKYIRAELASAQPL